MLSMAEKGIRGEICHTTNRYERANNKYMKDYNKRNLHNLNIGMWIIYMVGQCGKSSQYMNLNGL